jgi:hypothetical protein
VRTVFPALHTGVTVRNALLVSKNVAEVAVVFIAALKVKTMAALGETPEALVAGTDEIIVGPAARACGMKVIALITGSTAVSRQARRKRQSEFKHIIRIQIGFNVI